MGSGAAFSAGAAVVSAAGGAEVSGAASVAGAGAAGSSVRDKTRQSIQWTPRYTFQCKLKNIIKSTKKRKRPISNLIKA